jgi:hypothetical protein
MVIKNATVDPGFRHGCTQELRVIRELSISPVFQPNLPLASEIGFVFQKISLQDRNLASHDTRVKKQKKSTLLLSQGLYCPSTKSK